MSATRLLNILALSTLAVLYLSFAPSQTLALSIRSNHLARELPDHHGLAKKKRATKRCKPKSSTSSTPAPKSTDPPTKEDSSKSDPPPSTTEPPKNVETTPPTNTPTGSGKLAIAWAMWDDPRIALLKEPRVRMFHLWDAEIPPAVKKTGIPVSIMLWGTGQDKINKFLKFAKPGYATHAYGFNEVNEVGQANLGVGQAIDAWRKYLKPLANDGYTLGSPCTSSRPNGFDWMKDFISQCPDCHFDELPIHWYDVEFKDFQTYVNKWAGFKKPLRVTEFACQNFNGGPQPSMDEVWSFTDQAIKFLESDSRILSYAPFGFMDDMYNVAYTNKLFSDNGLSDLGWKYVNGD